MDKENFKPHMMYDKTGKGYMANTYEDHLSMKKKGYAKGGMKKKGYARGGVKRK